MPIKIVDTVGKAVNPGTVKESHNPVKSVTTKKVGFHKGGSNLKPSGGVIYANT